jgi:hypothetical protein
MGATLIHEKYTRELLKRTNKEYARMGDMNDTTKKLSQILQNFKQTM